MFIPISIVVAVILHTINNIALPLSYKIGLKKKGKLIKDEKTSAFKFLRGYILDFIPYLNIMSIIINLFADICLIAFYDKIIDNYSDTYSAEYIKNKYERNESDKKDIAEAMTLEGATKEEINSEMKKIASLVGKKEKGSSFRVDPDFSEKDYEWACTYLDAERFLDSLFTDVTIPEKEKYEIIKELIKLAKNVDSIPAIPIEDEELETKNPMYSFNSEEKAKSRAVSNKVLGIINKHL